MHPRFRSACALALVSTLVLGLPAGAAPSPKRRAQVAAGYIAANQNDDGSLPGFSAIGSTADAVVAFSAAKRGRKPRAKALRFLRRNVEDASDVGLKAKVILAAVVAGADPRDFGGVDLVDEILSTMTPEGRFGAGTPVFHHALALIALEEAGAEQPIEAGDWLFDARCPDGGWQFDEPSGPADDEHCVSGPQDFFASETDATATAVIALAGEFRWEPGDDRDPFAFFETRRDPVKKGWGYDLNNPLTSSNSTALVIEAYRKHRYRDRPNRTRKALSALQYRLCGKRAGAFAFTYEQRDNGSYKKTVPDVGATIGATLGLRPRPDGPVAIRKPAPRPGCR